jgi:hypothetical protein
VQGGLRLRDKRLQLCAAAAADEREVPEAPLLRQRSSVRKAASFSDFQSFHNDRLIDGPLPSPLRTVAMWQQQLIHVVSSSSSSGEADQGAEGRAQSAEGRTDEARPAEGGRRASEGGDDGEDPLCFVISGGVPHGRVSFSVTTVPLQSAAAAQRQRNGTQDDWRALS